MHEMSLCESIVKIVERQAQKERVCRVVTVRVALGDQSCASEESLNFCFPIVAKGTLAEGAALAFIRTAGNDLRVVEIEVS
ncbi:MAG: hydrogenase maturation nickel metallochaperone HypA [Alphaproteobacteria bacterium]|nr:hydrogenase maturation nickel metallochaperone HypA [Alphaproteobacteria bacterium]